MVGASQGLELFGQWKARGPFYPALSKCFHTNGLPIGFVRSKHLERGTNVGLEAVQLRPAARATY